MLERRGIEPFNVVFPKEIFEEGTPETLSHREVPGERDGAHCEEGNPPGFPAIAQEPEEWESEGYWDEAFCESGEPERNTDEGEAGGLRLRSVEDSEGEQDGEGVKDSERKVGEREVAEGEPACGGGKQRGRYGRWFRAKFAA